MTERKHTTHRVFVSTDLGGDPDDIQSLYRLLHYSDILRVEGISSCTGPGSTPRADVIREWIRRVDVEHLRARGYPELMPEEGVLASVRQGATACGAPSHQRRTEGSDLIIEKASAGDPEGKDRPLWVLVWGSTTDIAQALHDDPAIAPKIRIHMIGSTNTTHDPESRDYLYGFMENRFPELWWIENGILPRMCRDTFRGVYEGGNQEGEWHQTEFIRTNIRGHGSTHEGEFDELCGDAFPFANWPKNSLKEGDSPTMLYLVAPVLAGVGNVDDPEQESWGGRYHRPDPGRFPNYYTDLEAPAEACRETISKWRLDFLGHWKERWDRYEIRR